MTISYDATSKTYTIQSAGLTAAFSDSDLQPSPGGDLVYSNQNGRLTLVTWPYSGASGRNRYTAMGYWQRNTRSPGLQQTEFSTFTYGFGTPATSLPRTGTAHWLTDIFGMLSMPTLELRTVQGSADFDVDFAAGVFKLDGRLIEINVLTNGGNPAPASFQAGGSLSADGSYGGLLSYQSSSGAMHGSLAGQFYGPAAEEIGASFSAEGPGGVLTGALTGQRNSVASSAQGLKNVTLTGATATERVQGPAVGLAVDPVARSDFLGTDVTLGAGGPLKAGFQFSYDLDPKDRIASSPNFITYGATIGVTPVTVALYKVGSENGELALTYTSFISWTWGEIPDAYKMIAHRYWDANYGVYGIRTPPELIAARTGAASYDGLIYGKAGTLGGTYDLTGTSRFDVDFSASRYTGSLNINGAGAGGSTVAFGQFGFSAPIDANGMKEASIVGASVNPSAVNTIRPQLYGPTGQEIGAAFLFNISHPTAPNGLVMTGVALAKER
jgi:hypothetical protein